MMLHNVFELPIVYPNCTTMVILVRQLAVVFCCNIPRHSQSSLMLILTITTEDVDAGHVDRELAGFDRRNYVEPVLFTMDNA